MESSLSCPEHPLLPPFSSRSTLNRHLRNHSPTKTYACDECPYKSSQFSNLKQHRLTHTNSRPVRCSSCEKSFKSKYGLRRHRKRCHKSVAAPTTSVVASQTSAYTSSSNIASPIEVVAMRQPVGVVHGPVRAIAQSGPPTSTQGNISMGGLLADVSGTTWAAAPTSWQALSVPPPPYVRSTPWTNSHFSSFRRPHDAVRWGRGDSAPEHGVLTPRPFTSTRVSPSVDHLASPGVNLAEYNLPHAASQPLNRASCAGHWALPSGHAVTADQVSWMCGAGSPLTAPGYSAEAVPYPASFARLPSSAAPMFEGCCPGTGAATFAAGNDTMHEFGFTHPYGPRDE